MHTAPVSRQRLHVCCVAFVAALVCSFPASTQEPPGDGPPPTTLSLGLGGISRQQPYTGIARDNMAIPFIHFENRYVEIMGPLIGLKIGGLDITESQTLHFSLVGKYDGHGYKADDAAILHGMATRKGAFWVGGKLEWNSELMDVSAEWLTDATRASKGQLLNLELEKTWHLGQHMMLTPRLGATWQDKKYVDYYFGVRNNEMRIDRPAYTGKSGVNAEVGVRGIYMFNRRHSVFADFEVSSLSKAIKDSPLVDRSTENRVFLGYLYRIR